MEEAQSDAEAPKKKTTTFATKKTTEDDKKTTTFASKERGPEGVWDSLFRRLCEVNYGCCCCASLRTGTVIVAWVFVFWFFLEILGSLMVACAYNGWLKIDFLIAEGDVITNFHKADPFIYVIMATLEFCLSVVLLIGVFNESNMKFKFIRVFVQSFIILIAVGVVYEAAKFVAFVSVGEKNSLRIYGSLLSFVVVQGLYGWATIVVKCYYVEITS